jgi:hypothetical protein
MKHLSPLAAALLLASCAVTPEDQHAAHQRRLEKEARENFIALKAQEHPGRAVVLNDEGPAASTRAHTAQRTRSAQPTPVVRPVFASNPQPWYARPATSRDDTVYYWQTETIARRTTPQQRVAEAKYAQSLAKRTEDLTPEERLWAHEHY